MQTTKENDHVTQYESCSGSDGIPAIENGYVSFLIPRTS